MKRITFYVQASHFKCQKQAHPYLVLLCICIVESQGMKTKTLAVPGCSAQEQLHWDVAWAQFRFKIVKKISFQSN